MDIKQIVKQVVPPAIFNFLKPSLKYGWFGNFDSWEKAQDVCKGYDSDEIFEKVKYAAQYVRDGKASFERDSVLFYKEEYNWKVLTCLMFIATKQNGVLHVTDFGGSLGSFFYQHKKFWAELKDLKWGVIEQSHFVEYGRQELKELEFYYFVEESLQNQKPQTLLLSSVLQYLEKPFDVLKQLIAFNFDYIIIDRTAFTSNDNHELSIQRVDPRIYSASYPAWFFNEEEFLKVFNPHYNMFLSFENDDFTNRVGSYFKGYFMAKKRQDDA
jgi:putative methyltransferase (TIGR04325 family)